MADLPDEQEWRWVAILNKKIETGKLMNALGHMTAGLASGGVDTADICLLQYEDKDGNTHPNISHYPFIVLKADNSNKIRTVRNEAIARNIPFTNFTSSMTVGTSQEQLDEVHDTAEEDLEYWGICLFGRAEELQEFTSKFSLFQ